MFFSQREQLLLVLQSVLLGAGVGLLYELLRVLRYRLHAGTALTAIFDLLFWLLFLGVLFRFNLLFAQGLSRAYVLWGMAAGAAVYFYLLGSLSRAILQGASELLFRLWQQAKKPLWLLRDTVTSQRCTEKKTEKKKKFEKNSSLFRGKGLK